MLRETMSTFFIVKKKQKKKFLRYSVEDTRCIPGTSKSIGANQPSLDYPLMIH